MGICEQSVCAYVYGERGSVDYRDTGELEHVILLVAFKVIFVLSRVLHVHLDCTVRMHMQKW